MHDAAPLHWPVNGTASRCRASKRPGQLRPKVERGADRAAAKQRRRIGARRQSRSAARAQGPAQGAGPAPAAEHCGGRERGTKRTEAKDAIRMRVPRSWGAPSWRHRLCAMMASGDACALAARSSAAGKGDRRLEDQRRKCKPQAQPARKHPAPRRGYGRALEINTTPFTAPTIAHRGRSDNGKMVVSLHLYGGAPLVMAPIKPL